MTTPISVPDLSKRQYRVLLEHKSPLPARTIYSAWTEQIDRWFAAPGMVLMKAEVNAVYFFETQFDGQRHPHYGRFLRLEPDRLVEMTWVTGSPGTGGAETVVTVELAPNIDGTQVTLVHAGFYDEETCSGHEQAWTLVLNHLDEKMA